MSCKQNSLWDSSEGEVSRLGGGQDAAWAEQERTLSIFYILIYWFNRLPRTLADVFKTGLGFFLSDQHISS